MNSLLLIPIVKLNIENRLLKQNAQQQNAKQQTTNATEYLLPIFFFRLWIYKFVNNFAKTNDLSPPFIDLSVATLWTIRVRRFRRFPLPRQSAPKTLFATRRFSRRQWDQSCSNITALTKKLTISLRAIFNVFIYLLY